MKGTNKNERRSKLFNKSSNLPNTDDCFLSYYKKNINTLKNVIKLNYLEFELYSAYFHLGFDC